MSKEKESLTCGIIMPISAIDGCSAEHWIDVKSIFIEAMESIEKYSVKAKIVSDSDDVGVIQKRIVQNIYNSDIVICDVSGKNPNVMFELGMRLAFDKPTIIVKDDKTNYSFDTSIIEHIEYPRDLRFGKIVEFKTKISSKIIATYEEFVNKPDSSIFLGNFGEFKVAKLNETEVSVDKMTLDILSDIQSELMSIKRNVSDSQNKVNVPSKIKKYEFKKRVLECINRYRIENNISDCALLLNDRKLYNWVESEYSPNMIFDSRDEFVAYMNLIIDELILESSAKKV